MGMAVDSPSDATEVGGLADDASDVAHSSSCGGQYSLNSITPTSRLSSKLPCIKHLSNIC